MNLKSGTCTVVTINPVTFVALKDAGIKEGLTKLNIHRMCCAHWVQISTGWIARVLDYQGMDKEEYIDGYRR